jgi:hypothetical protein
MGLEAGGFLLEDRGSVFGLASTPGGNPLLALRHLDPPAGSENAFVLSAPASAAGAVGPFVGGVAVRTDTQLWGAEANLLHAFCCSNDFHLVGLVGFRYLDLADSATILTRKAATGSSAVVFLGKSFSAGALEVTDDQFSSRSQFYGGQLGLRAQYFFGRCFVELGSKLGLGRTGEVEKTLGISVLQPQNAPPQTAGGGLFALPSNSGRFVNQDFAVIPEVQVKGGIFLAPWLRATVGYDLLYWSRVLRAGQQIDLSVDTRQVPTDPSYVASSPASFPRSIPHPSDFWVQGLTFGLELTF